MRGTRATPQVWRGHHVACVRVATTGLGLLLLHGIPGHSGETYTPLIFMLRNFALPPFPQEWMALSATGRGHGAAAAPPPPRGTSAAGTSGPLAALVAALPRSLGVLPGLPALASGGAAAGAAGGTGGGGTGGGPQWGWSAPSLAALREFFRDLHPHQRHVSHRRCRSGAVLIRLVPSLSR